MKELIVQSAELVISVVPSIIQKFVGNISKLFTLTVILILN